jgi:histone H3/H4
MEFAVQALRRIFKKAGAKRVSDSAAEELGRILEQKTKLLLDESKELSKHANRKTVMRQDVKAAKKSLEK